MAEPVTPKVGRIRYINVLPIYYALERGVIRNGFEMVAGTPAELNDRMFRGELHLSAISSVEYGRHWRQYYLLPDLSISTMGDVGSVLFFSRVPFGRLTGREVLLSAASATSVALLKILLYELYGVRPLYRSARIQESFPDGAYGLLAIGDEALKLKATGRYPYFLDLGRAWHDLTGLPFVFGVWAVRRDFYARHPEVVEEVHQTLLDSKAHGLAHLQAICRQAATQVSLSLGDLINYFKLLNYDLAEPQQVALLAFYRYLVRAGALPELPALAFIGTDRR
uniref:Chorismate dehydratase n=1 Tax=Desulfobacca acetoxidans TaxID=60893 RepID=A0A7V4G8S5_9BACT